MTWEWVHKLLALFEDVATIFDAPAHRTTATPTGQEIRAKVADIRAALPPEALTGAPAPLLGPEDSGPDSSGGQ